MKVGSVKEHGKGVWTQEAQASYGTVHTIRIVTHGDRFLGLIKHYEVDVDGHPIPDARHRNREAAIR
ncbi:MAG: hypothetical protein PVSMB7_00710 [Chloroflexota bacterium]